MPARSRADSAGTAGWHAGEPADRRTLAVLRQHGIPYAGRSRQIQQRDLKHFDLIVAMDSENLSDLLFLDRDRSLNGKLHRLMDFAPVGYPKDVPDPYYNGQFDLRLRDGGCRRPRAVGAHSQRTRYRSQ